MTQASMLPRAAGIDRVSKALQLHLTSPSYLLLASLDAARQQMALQGEQLMASTLQLADDAKTESARFRIVCFTICRDDAWFCYSRQNCTPFLA